MSRGFLLIDGNSIGHAAAATKKLTVGEQETQAIYGFLRSMRPAVTLYNMLTPIVLWDGVSWRYETFPDYKAARNKEPVAKYEIEAKRTKDSYKQQAPFIRTALRHLGVRQMWAFNLEADDLAGILVRRFQPQGKNVVLMTADKDWIQLVQPRVGWFDPINNRRINVMNLEKELGVKSARAYLEVKALMGDPSDGIPGVGGIGEKGAKELVNTYGSVADFSAECTAGTLDTSKLHKKFRAFAEDEDKRLAFLGNMVLMDLNNRLIPKPKNLQLTGGVFDRAAFETFCQEFVFRSILKDLDDWCAPFIAAPNMMEKAA